MTDSKGLRPRLLAIPRTIRGLAIGFAIVAALVTMLLGRVTLDLVHEALERQLDDQIEVETRALIQYEREHGFQALVDAVRLRDQDGTGYVAGADPTVSRTMGYIVADAAGRRRAGNLQAVLPRPGYSEFVRFTRREAPSASRRG